MQVRLVNVETQLDFCNDSAVEKNISNFWFFLYLIWTTSLAPHVLWKAIDYRGRVVLCVLLMV